MWKYNYSNELMHYGILGMKWGHRKAQSTSAAYNKMRNAKSAYKTSKSAYKTAIKESKKAYRKMHNRSANHPIATNFTKKGRAKYEKAFDDYYDAEKNKRNKRTEYRDAKKEYKQAKADRKEKIESQTKELNKKASFGEKLIYNNATRRKAAKYIVDNNMSVSEATKKAQGYARRKTAAMIAFYGASAVAHNYAMNK